jgi:aldehyde dehydrogenase (NAD+)
MQGEIFGPVLPILKYRALEEVYDFTRTHGKPLALYVFSRSRSAAEQIIDAIPAGGSCINNTILHLANPNIPFGGAGESGQGNYHGIYGFRTFSHERAVLLQRNPAFVRFFYPPYRVKVEKLIGWASKIVS